MHKSFIRKIFIPSTPLWALDSFYENQITQFSVPQNLERILIYCNYQSVQIGFMGFISGNFFATVDLTEWHHLV